MKMPDHVRFVDLFESGRSLGKFDVPAYIPGNAAGCGFSLGPAIKTGGNGVVFQATEVVNRKPIGPPCAVKILKQLSRPRIDRFANEVRVLQDLASPYISKFLDAGEIVVESKEGEQRTVPWAAMHLGGANMRQHVEANGPLKLHHLKSITHGMTAAIEHLHQKGFIHRDIKPENFVWRSTGNTTTPMMIDFGRLTLEPGGRWAYHSTTCVRGTSREASHRRRYGSLVLWVLTGIA